MACSMKLISRQTDYAVNMLCILAGTRGTASVTDICKQIGLPRSFSRGILQQLSKKGLLCSTRGKGGGFKLAIAPQKIRLYDIMQIFQDISITDQCMFQKKPCFRKTSCVMRGHLSAIENLIGRRLKAITVASLLSSNKAEKAASR